MGRYKLYNSSYILAEKHKTTTKGTIFERDWSTLGGVHRLSKGKRPYFSDSNFIFTENSIPSFNKKYNYGNWVSNFNYDDVKNNDGSVNQVKVNNYSDTLTSYAYYGSASSLIMGAITNIVSKFPGRLKLSNNTLTVLGDDNSTFVNLGYVVDNPFEINLHTNKIDYEGVDNELRWMSLSYDKYVIKKYDSDGDLICESPVIGIEREENYSYVKTNKRGVEWTPLDELPEQPNSSSPQYVRITKHIEETTSCPIYAFYEKIKTFSSGENHCNYKEYMPITLLGCNDCSVTITPYKVDGQIIYTLAGDPDGYEDSTYYYKETNVVLNNSDEWEDVTEFPTDVTSESKKYIRLTIEGDCPTYFFYEKQEVKGINKVTEPNFTFVIEPNETEIEKYFNSLEGFEALLLRRDTKPLYRNRLMKPYMVEERNTWYNTYEYYTWPSDDYCISVNTAPYFEFVQKLLELGEIYDKTYCDNMWNRMTHEAIRNFDWCYHREHDDNDLEDNIAGGNRMEQIIHFIGKVFDDVKRNIDGIKMTNTVTYSGMNNLPDAELSDKNELNGWEAFSTVWFPYIYEPIYATTDVNGPILVDYDEFLDVSDLDDIKHYKKTYGKDGCDVIVDTSERTVKVSDCYNNMNNPDSDSPEFVFDGSHYWHLVLNDTTKIRLDEYLSDLLDANEDNRWYNNINPESIAPLSQDIEFQRRLFLSTKRIFTTKGTLEGIRMVLGMFGLIEGEDYDLFERYNTVEPKYYNQTISTLQQIYTNEEGILNESFMEFDEVPLKSIEYFGKTVIVPFMEQENWYRGNDIYFQSKGGWMHYDRDLIQHDPICTPESYKFEKYNETVPYMKVVGSISDLLTTSNMDIPDGVIYYVASLADYTEYNMNPPSDLSHFFKLTGLIPSSFSSWKHIPMTGPIVYPTYDCTVSGYDPDITHEDYRRAKYLESILPIETGNNPHVGFGEYDDGETYREYINKPFKHLIETYSLGEVQSNLADGFTYPLTEFDVQDGKFKYVDVDDRFYESISLLQYEFGVNETYQSVNDIPTGDTVTDDSPLFVRYEKGNDEYGYKKRVRNDKVIVNMTSDSSNPDYYINDKKFVLKNLHTDDILYKRFFNDIISNYLTQLIPSTSIFILEDYEVEMTSCPNECNITLDMTEEVDETCDITLDMTEEI